jgi:hypothetical protein
VETVLGIWAGLAFFALIWTGATTAAGSRLPNVGDVTGLFLRSWLGRSFSLALWAYLGWHLFCQRP